MCINFSGLHAIFVKKFLKRVKLWWRRTWRSRITSMPAVSGISALILFMSAFVFCNKTRVSLPGNRCYSFLHYRATLGLLPSNLEINMCLVERFVNRFFSWILTYIFQAHVSWSSFWFCTECSTACYTEAK